jgi:hypothetical protein
LSLNSQSYSFRTPDWAFMSYPDGSTELYDMKSDPHQFTNLSAHSDYEHVRTRMTALLSARLTAAGLLDTSGKRRPGNSR